ncbi:unnamed protein product [Strongylus vulgaris]|uniref:Uncharacterized protein n=1 Tax=Strongylus vulgaris TaxID=40348 RepID=A0A3P7L628_STRVU|nr:unnamed protein product [Strongylus vulgaris]
MKDRRITEGAGGEVLTKHGDLQYSHLPTLAVRSTTGGIEPVHEYEAETKANTGMTHISGGNERLRVLKMDPEWAAGRLWCWCATETSLDRIKFGAAQAAARAHQRRRTTE